MSTQQDINAIRAQQFTNAHDPLALMANTQAPFHPDHSLPTYNTHNNFVQQPSFNTNYMQQPMQNPKDILDPTTAIDMIIALMSKAFTLNNTTPTNNNQRSSSNPSNMQIAQSGMNMDQDRHMLMVDDNVGNQFKLNAVQNIGYFLGLNAVQKQAPAEGNGNGINANCTLENNLQQASKSSTQSDKAPVYDSDRSAEVYLSENCYDNDIFNMFTQEEQYTELLEPIPEPHQVQQNDNIVLSMIFIVEQGGRTIEQHSANVEETRVLYDSLYNNLAIKIEKVNSVNRKLRETNADLTTELARYKNQEKCFEISQEKYDKLKRVQNFEIQFLKEAAKFVRDFKSLAKGADESLVKHKTLELETERLLRAFDSQDIMSVVQNNSIEDTSNLQTELEQWKYDKFSYDKAYNDMQQKIERLQAQLGDLKGKSKDTPCVLNTPDPLSQKLENENDTTHGTITNTKFAKQSILGKPPSSSRPKLYAVTPLPKSKVIPKIDESHALSKPVTSNSIPTPTESKVMKNDNVISPGIFRINPFKASRYVNDMKSSKKNQSANVLNVENQKKHKPKVRKPKKVRSKERLASSKPSIPRSCLRQNWRDLPKNTPLDRVEVLGGVLFACAVRIDTGVIGVHEVDVGVVMRVFGVRVSYGVRMTLKGKKTWWLRLEARVYDLWKLQGDAEELWDELAKLRASMKMWESLVEPRHS
nr:hypothetical protein [Tanacetum cinerariifolium]